jgi:hypothetical protein
MLNIKPLICLIVLAAVPLTASPSWAQSANSAVKYDFSIGQALQSNDALSSSTLLDSVTFEPKRISDVSSVTTASARGQFSPNVGSTIDFSYNMALNSYFKHAAFNFLNNTAGVGYSRRLNKNNVASIRVNGSRAFANSTFSPYYWSGHVAAGLAQSYSTDFSVVYGIDGYRYQFDNSNSLDSKQIQYSATPSYRFQSMPAVLTTVIRYTDNNANSKANSYAAIDIEPRFSYTLENKHFLSVSGQYRDSKFDGFDTVLTTSKRKDHQYMGSINYYMPVTLKQGPDNLFAQFGYTFTRNDSNIARQDYQSNSFRAGLGARF